jgi:N-acetylglucosamine malate deacetylase 1
VKQKILVVAPHPDDETLGCGGTILKHIRAGDEVHWLVVTNITAEEWGGDKVKIRQVEIKKVSQMYQFKSTNNLNLPAAKLDSILMSDIVGKVSKVIQKIQPRVVYINNYSDVHTDHQITFKAVISATKSFRHPYIEKILMYETLSETEFYPKLGGISFQPNIFVDITDFFSIKCQIMKEYGSEVMDSPYPRSIDTIESLARYRGARIGEKYAEAFQLIHEKL